MEDQRKGCPVEKNPTTATREMVHGVRTCQTSSADSESGSDMGSASGGGAGAVGGGSTGLTFGRTGKPARKAECTGAD